MPLSMPHPWPPEGRPDPRRLLRVWYQVVLAAPVHRTAGDRDGGFPGQILAQGRASAGQLVRRGALTLYEGLLRRPGYVNASAQYYRSFLLRELAPLAARRVPIEAPDRAHAARRGHV